MLGTIHIIPEEFKNEGFTLKTHQMFSVHTAPEEWKKKISLRKRIKCLLSKLHQWNFKTQHSPVILDLSLRKTRSGKSRDYRDVIVFGKLCTRFQNVFHLHDIEKLAFSNSCFKSVVEKLRFRDWLVRTVGLTVEIKLHFQISTMQCGLS